MTPAYSRPPANFPDEPTTQDVWDRAVRLEQQADERNQQSLRRERETQHAHTVTLILLAGVLAFFLMLVLQAMGRLP